MAFEIAFGILLSSDVGAMEVSCMPIDATSYLNKNKKTIWQNTCHSKLANRYESIWREVVQREGVVCKREIEMDVMKVAMKKSDEAIYIDALYSVQVIRRSRVNCFSLGEGDALRKELDLVFGLDSLLTDK